MREKCFYTITVWDINQVEVKHKVIGGNNLSTQAEPTELWRN